MREAIELAIAEESPYPEASAFINAGTAYTDGQIKRALEDGYAAVVVSKHGSVEVLRPAVAISASQRAARLPGP